MENVNELNRLTEKAAKVKGMIEHPGWKDVVEPMLKATCEAALSLVRVAKTMDDLQRARTSLVSAEFLLGIPEVVIAEGVDANDKLEALKKKE